MDESRSLKILIIEPDVRVTEMLVDCLGRRFGARITCAGRGEDALDVEIVEPHDLAIADVDLPGIDGIELARHLLELSDRPVIMTSGRPTLGQAIEAMRLGVTDYLPKPYPLPYLEEVAEKALRAHLRRQQRQRRYHHLRRVARKAETERQALNDRIDLICRDLVSAHRRLVHRVLEHEQAQKS